MKTLRKRRELEIGTLIVTSGTMCQIQSGDALACLTRHARGDYGDVSDQSWQANEEARETGGRIHSAYCDRDGNRFFIITEADRLATTILLLDEY